MSVVGRIVELAPINRELAGNPVNWIIVFLMVLFAGLALSLVFHPTDQTGD